MGKPRKTARAREMAELLAACDRSGLPQSTFARQHGITPGAFAWWRHTLRPRRSRVPQGATAFIEVTPTARSLATTGEGEGSFVVRLPSGAIVRVPSRFEGAALETLLGVLARSC